MHTVPHSKTLKDCGTCVQAWCLVVSSMGDFVVTSGADRALRVWQRTEEPFFVEEEKEKRLESLFEADLEVSTCLPQKQCYYTAMSLPQKPPQRAEKSAEPASRGLQA